VAATLGLGLDELAELDAADVTEPLDPVAGVLGGVVEAVVFEVPDVHAARIMARQARTTVPTIRRFGRRGGEILGFVTPPR
jgi:hypothetical protein